MNIYSSYLLFDLTWSEDGSLWERNYFTVNGVKKDTSRDAKHATA